MTPRISATPTSAALRADTRAAGRLEEAARSWVEVGSEVPTSPSYWPVPKPADAEIVGAGLEWTVSMISELSIALQVNRRDPEAGVPELALDDDQRDALMSHLDGVSVSELVRREAAPDAR